MEDFKMAFCKYCGNEIAEGETCTCAESQADKNNAAPAAPASAPTPSAAPTDNGSENKPSLGGLDAAKLKNFAPVAALCAAALLVIILIVALCAGGGYKKPLKNFAKGINKEDAETFLSAFYSEDMIEDSDAYDGDFDDAVDAFDDILDTMIDSLEDEYGKDVRLKIDIDSKKAVKSKKLKDFEDYYDDNFDMDVTIKKAYKVSCTFEIEGDKDDDEMDDIDLVLIKVKGEGWKIYMGDGGSSLFRF